MPYPEIFCTFSTAEKEEIQLDQSSPITKTLSEIMECTAEVHSSTNLQTILSTATECVPRLSRSEACFCFIRDIDSGHLLFHEAVGPGDCKPTLQRVPIEQGIAGWVARYGEPVMLQDVRSDPRFDAAIDECRGFPTVSILAVPIRQKEEIIGVFEAINKNQGELFSRDDASLLTRFADQVAIAVNNAAAYERKDHPARLPLILQDNEHEILKERAIERMSVGIAHNFKNILNAITGFSEIVLVETKEESVRKCIQGIRNACDSALDLVNQLEAFTEKRQPNKKPLNIKNLFKQTIKLFRLRLPETISIHQELAEGDATMVGDSARLHRAIMNLLKNAQESFNGHPGKVFVQYKTIDMVPGAFGLNGSLPAGRYVKLVVRDNGHGMNQKTMDQIFEPYFTTKKGGVGTGIGLSIVKRIIKEHDGDITVSSIPQKGTTIEVYLPSSISEPAVQQPSTPEKLARGDEKILVVDDEELLASVLARMLSALGYHVTKVNSSKEALDVYRKSHADIDLVITDWALPEITGDHLAEMMIKINPAAKVVLFSAFDKDVDKKHLLSCGIRDVLKKPITMKDLAAVVRKTLDADL